MTHDVFICYSSKDKTVADAACAVLEQKGIRCWIAPRDILPGASWAGSIVNAIDDTKSLLLIFSESANSSPQIEREIERAVNRRIPVVPFRIEDILPTEALEYFISANHWLDAFSPPIHRHYQVLASKIEALLEQHDTAHAPADLTQHAEAPRHATQPAPNRWPIMIAAGAVVVAALVVVGVVLGGRAKAPGAQTVVAASSAPTPALTQAAAPAGAVTAANSGVSQFTYQSYPANLDPNGDDWLAIRSAPNGGGERVAKIGPQTQFQVIEQDGGAWSKVQLIDGRTGWVASKYIGCCRTAVSN